MDLEAAVNPRSACKAAGLARCCFISQRVLTETAERGQTRGGEGELLPLRKPVESRGGAKSNYHTN